MPRVHAYNFTILQRPLYQRKKRDVFDKICNLTDEKHFVVVNAYLIEGNYTSACVGVHICGFDLFYCRKISRCLYWLSIDGIFPFG